MLVPNAEAFIAEAHEHGKEGLILIENHNMRDEDVARMDAGLPATLALGAEHVLYYYYPRNLQNPERNMQCLAQHLRAARGV